MNERNDNPTETQADQQADKQAGERTDEPTSKKTTGKKAKAKGKAKAEQHAGARATDRDGAEGRGRRGGPGRGPRGGGDGRSGRGPWGGAEGRPGRGGRGRGRMGRGEVRPALLIALQDGPAHGYELITLLDERTGGRWRPSPGSVYPTLQLLADEGLVTETEREGRRIYELTDAGRAEAERHIAEHGYPWDAMGEGGSHSAYRTALRDLHHAARQVAMSGSPETVAQATTIVTQARKDLYRLLADA